MGEDDRGVFLIGQLLPRLPQKITEKTLFQIEKVIRAFGQETVIKGLKNLGVIFQGFRHRILGGVLVILDECLNLTIQLRISKHLQMGGKDGPVFFAQLGSNLITIFRDLIRNGLERFGPTVQFDIRRVMIHESPRNPESLVVENQRFANRQTWRDRYSLQNLHGQRGPNFAKTESSNMEPLVQSP